MDNLNFEKTQEYLEQIKELLAELSDTAFYDKWSDTFDIEIVDKKHVMVSYHGYEDFNAFKKECKEILTLCICSIMGGKRKVKIVKQSVSKSFNPKTKKNIKAFNFFVIGMIFACLAAAAIVILCSYIENRNFRENFYSTSSIKVDSRVRVIQLSDIHGVSYGNNNEKLIKRIKALEPDIIICTGDIVNSAKEDLNYAVNLANELTKIAPSYYIYGNNEVESIYNFPLNEKTLDKKFGFTKENRDESALLKLKDTFEEKLEETGIKVLKNEMDTIKVKTMTIDVYGVLTSNPSSFWSYSEKAFANYLNENPDNIKITAVHEPIIFQEFNPDFWGDLMVSGHTHGGLVRVPVLGPLYTNENGLFPERSGAFVYGRYDAAGSPLIVSSGLDNSNLLRINNQPELVVIDINKF